MSECVSERANELGGVTARGEQTTRSEVSAHDALPEVALLMKYEATLS